MRYFKCFYRIPANIFAILACIVFFNPIEVLANKLLETEVIFKEDLEVIFGKRPFQKEEIKTEVKKEETANKTKKVIPKKTSSPKKTSDTSDKSKSKKSA